MSRLRSESRQVEPAAYRLSRAPLRYIFQLLLFAGASQAQGARLDCASSGPIELPVPKAPATLTVELHPSRPAWLWIEELGHDLRIGSDPHPDNRQLQVPPRFGLSLLRIEAAQEIVIERVLDNAAAARVNLGLECGPLPADLQGWLADADAVARHFGGGLGSLRSVTPPAALRSLVDTAPSPRWRAFALHVNAQWLLLAGHSVESAPAFLDAAAAWEAVGAAPKAAAARVAAAENLRLAGNGQAVLALSRAAPGAPEAQHYFGVRLEAARCGALFEAGDLAPATACFDWVLQAYAALGEPLEAANAAINRADLDRRLGHHARARSVVEDALASVSGPQSDAVRGRAELSLAETAVQLGDLPAVLLHLQSARTSFQSAGEARWQAHVLRRLAATLLELGNLADAQLALDAAQALLDPTLAPLPHASGQLLQARLWRARGEARQSLPLLEASLAAARTGAQRELQNLTLLELASTHIELDDTPAAVAMLQQLVDPSPRERARLELLRALASEDDANARVLEAALARSPLSAKAGTGADWTTLSLAERVDLQRALAGSKAASGRIDQAHEDLLQAARALAERRADSGNALLAQALERLILRLRSTAIELVARARPATSDARTEALLLEWLELSLPLPARGLNLEWSALDAEIGRLLLGEPPGDHSHALLRAMANTPRSPADSPAHTAAGPPAREVDLRATLDAQAPLHILLAGEQHALYAVWTGQGLHVRALADLAGLQQQLAGLASLARAPQEPLQDLHAAAAGVARHLRLGPSDLGAETFDILADDLALQVEWALLPGPEGEPLGSSHRIRLRQPAWADSPTASVAPLQLLQAAQWQNAHEPDSTRSGSRLPALQAAAAEAELIRAALPGRAVEVQPLTQRETLLTALGHAGAWLHVSAHGHLQPGLLAGSGLWLDPSDDDAAPQFMSALDIRRQGTQAAHVVLNACQLAANEAPSPSQQSGQTSFAHSLVLAGTEHVIAARWPVSDTASHLWVPAYYRALQAQSERGSTLDPAAALREARRALQRSRAFRHPFHWAAWVHLQRMPLVPLVPTSSEVIERSPTGPPG